MGDKSFFGEGPEFTVNSKRPITVVTQWITEDGTDSGDLSEIRRVYVQDGKVIENSRWGVQQEPERQDDSITDEFCAAQKKAFGDVDDFKKKGGLKRFGEALDLGMVLVLSLWDDSLTQMSWLDSQMGRGGVSKPGVLRGPCPADSGRPDEVRAKYPSASVKYTNLMYGEINSTYTAGKGSKPEAHALSDAVYAAKLKAWSHPPPPRWSSGPRQQQRQVNHRPEVQQVLNGEAAAFQQCGGAEWTGPQKCQGGCECVSHGDYYSQCTPPSGLHSCDIERVLEGRGAQRGPRFSSAVESSPAGAPAEHAAGAHLVWAVMASIAASSAALTTLAGWRWCHQSTGQSHEVEGLQLLPSSAGAGLEVA